MEDPNNNSNFIVYMYSLPILSRTVHHLKIVYDNGINNNDNNNKKHNWDLELKETNISPLLCIKSPDNTSSSH